MDRLPGCAFMSHDNLMHTNGLGEVPRQSRQELEEALVAGVVDCPRRNHLHWRGKWNVPCQAAGAVLIRIYTGMWNAKLDGENEGCADR